MPNASLEKEELAALIIPSCGGRRGFACGNERNSDCRMMGGRSNA